MLTPLEHLLVYIISHWENVTNPVTALALGVIFLILIIPIYETFYPNTFLPDYPTLQLNLKTLEGRRRCYDEFCLHSLKRYQFEKYVGYRTKWFNFKARKRLFLMHMDLSVYEAMREAMCGSNANGTEINETLNK